MGLSALGVDLGRCLAVPDPLPTCRDVSLGLWVSFWRSEGPSNFWVNVSWD